ncbi:hypothetical protein GR240_36685 [Rhizobium leguminosarum]|nr:hypothetical protein [Rhizobium ruizarguesonis]
MVKLILPEPVASKILSALAVAGRQEIGGLLVAEHVGDVTFRIVDASIQTVNGTATHFERDPSLHARFLEEFFEKTSGDFTRFNYIGEWHSHPSFAPVPSRDDIQSMWSIISDPATSVNFAVLLIVRRGNSRKLILSATAFSVGSAPASVEVELEAGGISVISSRVGRLIKRLGF